ncbi:MAG: copper chaperone PCu(A)C [Thermoleophilia bacterium]
MRRSRLPLRAVLGALAIALVSVLAACGGSDSSSGSGGDGGLAIADVWARTSAEGQTMGAAYMTITGGGDADRLIEALAPTEIARLTEIHETVPVSEVEGAEPMDGMEGDSMEGMDMEGGAEMTMRPVEWIDVPAGGSVALEPGGYHIMLVDLAKPLAVGDTFDLTLTFEQAGEQTVKVTVRDA